MNPFNNYHPGFFYNFFSNNTYNDTQIVDIYLTVTMIHSSNMPFNSSVPLPDVISGDTLIWYYCNLLPGQTFGGGYISFNDPSRSGDMVFCN